VNQWAPGVWRELDAFKSANQAYRRITEAYIRLLRTILRVHLSAFSSDLELLACAVNICEWRNESAYTDSPKLSDRLLSVFAFSVIRPNFKPAGTGIA
jgi:hypothetical protein